MPAKQVRHKIKTHFTYKKYIAHFEGGKAETLYGSAGEGRLKLLVHDIDVQKSQKLGSSNGGKRWFKKYIRSNPLFKKIFTEPSPGGSGLHGIWTLDSQGASDDAVREVLLAFQAAMQLLPTHGWIEKYELKGIPTWKRWIGGKLQLTCGSLVSLPKAGTVEDWSACVVKLSELKQWLAEFDYPVAAKPEQKAAGSTAFTKEIDPDCLALAKKIFNTPADIEFLRNQMKGKRKKVLSEDLAVFLTALMRIDPSRNPQPDTLPTAQIKWRWNEMRTNGLTDRAPDGQRIMAMRNWLSWRGGIIWQDETYTFGRAMKWELDKEFIRTYNTHTQLWVAGDYRLPRFVLEKQSWWEEEAEFRRLNLLAMQFFDGETAA